MLSRLISAVMIALFSAGNAFAIDEDALVRILTKAFLAQNLTIYCAQFNPKILEMARGREGGISELALHVRAKVIEGLQPEEANVLVRRSADAARAGALLAIRRFYELDPGLQRESISEWCTKSIPVDVIEYIGEHDERHEEFIKKISSAKEAQ